MKINSSIDLLEALRQKNLITPEVYNLLLKGMVLNSGENKLAMVNELLDHDKFDLKEKKKYLEEKHIPTLLKIVDEGFSNLKSKDKTILQ